MLWCAIVRFVVACGARCCECGACSCCVAKNAAVIFLVCVLICGGLKRHVVFQSVRQVDACGKADEPEEVVVEVECGEALGEGEGGFPPCITSLMSPCIIK